MTTFNGNLDYWLNDIDSFIKERYNWSTTVITATTAITQDIKCMKDTSSNSDDVVQHTTNTNTMLPSPTGDDDLDSFITKEAENNCATVNPNGATATVVTQVDKGMIDTNIDINSNDNDMMSTTILTQPVTTTTTTTTVGDFDSFIKEREHLADAYETIKGSTQGEQSIIKTCSSDDVSTNIIPPSLSSLSPSPSPSPSPSLEATWLLPWGLQSFKMKNIV